MCDFTDFYLMSACQSFIRSAIDDTKHEEKLHVKSDKKTTAHNGNKRIPSFDEINAGYGDDMDIPTLDELKNM